MSKVSTVTDVKLAATKIVTAQPGPLETKLQADVEKRNDWRSIPPTNKQLLKEQEESDLLLAQQAIQQSETEKESVEKQSRLDKLNKKDKKNAKAKSKIHTGGDQEGISQSGITEENSTPIIPSTLLQVQNPKMGIRKL